MEQRKKLMLVSSSGGHWEELMCIRAVAQHHDAVYVTEEGGQAQDSGLQPLYTLPQINRRDKNFMPHLLKLYRRASRIVRDEKPDVLITTGALLSVPFCYAAKRRGVKVVYIESFARVTDKSLSGKLVYPIADLFLVQWESLLKLYPKARFVGGVF